MDKSKSVEMETKRSPGQQHRQRKTSLLVDQLNLDKPPVFRLLKQNQLSVFIKEFIDTFDGIETISFNESVNGYYPDIKFSFMGVVFIVEIDEHQHKRGIAYTEDREKKRIQSLKTSFRSLILIRINPDKSIHRPTPMISMFYNEVSRAKEIIVNSGEVEYRHREIEKVLHWIFFNLKQERQQNTNHEGTRTPEEKKFAEYKLFFDSD